MRLWDFESRNNPNIQNPLNLLKNPMIESESDYENKKGGYMICDPDFLRGIFQIIVKGFGKRTIR